MRHRRRQFAAVNQFYTLAADHNVDFARILYGCRHNYPRMAMMPGPGLTAGPCLVKDTMQLAAFSNNQFMLGHAAMLVNEGLPAHLVSMARRKVDMSSCTAGILGMAFKAESDDPRDSLSYKLKRLLAIEAKEVLCTDPYVKDPRLVPLDRVLAEADVLFVGVPHAAYRTLSVPAGPTVIDVWNCLPAAADGSRSRTADRVRLRRRRHAARPAALGPDDRPERVRLVRNRLGRGVRFAIDAGMREAEADVVMVSMADLSDDFSAAEEMVSRAERGAAVVCASRYMHGGAQHGGPWLKGLLSRMAGVSLHWLVGLPTHDPTNSFKAYRRDFLRRTPIESSAGFSLGLELTLKAHFAGERVEEVPAQWWDRTAGQSRFRLFAWLPLYLRWYFWAFGQRLRGRP